MIAFACASLKKTRRIEAERYVSFVLFSDMQYNALCTVTQLTIDMRKELRRLSNFTLIINLKL